MSIKTKVAGVRAIMAFDNWPMLLLSRMLYRNRGMVVYCKDRLQILVDHAGGDENGTRECIVGDMYRRYVPLFQLAGPANVLDIGANGGGFPLMLALEHVRLASVVSVEMNPATYSRLHVNLLSNIGPSAVAINAAVCGNNAPPEILLAPTHGSTGYSITGNSARESEPHVAVRTTNLQSLYDHYFLGRRIDICKIDIEGAEYELIDSTPDDVLLKIRYLIVEFHDAPRTPPLISRFARLGFSEITDKKNAFPVMKTEVRAFAAAS